MKRSLVSRYRMPQSIDEFVRALRLWLADAMDDPAINGTVRGPFADFDIDLGDDSRCPEIRITIASHNDAHSLKYPDPDEVGAGASLVWATPREADFLRRFRRGLATLADFGVIESGDATAKPTEASNGKPARKKSAR